MKLIRSLQTKYIAIILTALFLIQIAYLVMFLFVSGLQNMNGKTAQLGKESHYEIEEKWHKGAANLQDYSTETISRYFSAWKDEYPKASMFYVGDNGQLLNQVNVKEKLPSEWTPVYTAQFIKERYGGDPFTVIAFVGGDKPRGFIVLELPRTFFDPPLVQLSAEHSTALMLGVAFITLLYLTVSFLFFRGIRKRILQLQEAMDIRDVDGLPIQIHVKKMDEIGQLEQAFNQMVIELKASKERGQKEEQVRRELIANLSHDLRTPLTKIRAQIYSIGKEELSQQGQQSIAIMEKSIVKIDRLIENLMSYTLLMASKYKFEPIKLDIIRFARESFASWYPVFEKEAFHIEVDLKSYEDNIWYVDPNWMGSIIDNLLQNVIRHAKTGKYIELSSESTAEYDALVIIDKGKGMENESDEKGAGIGMSIVDLMVKGMMLEWNIESGQNGTKIKIKRNKKEGADGL
ncbi:sensor histidine kinase [Bacillus sp. FJAT-27245]|uniref:sensor histidine kinase n=1 Tax=Bacillus sp. FJAT-27245 TaxID=1684144 RepID=UPI0006A7B931|nr:HAMP domain-containing sensor histidine kinase [Bacillus sp. FJAT-27245]